MLNIFLPKSTAPAVYKPADSYKPAPAYKPAPTYHPAPSYKPALAYQPAPAYKPVEKKSYGGSLFREHLGNHKFHKKADDKPVADHKADE